MSYLVRNHLRHVQAPHMRLSTLKRFLREDGIDELLELTRIDALSSNGDLGYYLFCKERLASLKEEEIRPAPLLRGKVWLRSSRRCRLARRRRPLLSPRVRLSATRWR